MNGKNLALSLGIFAKYGNFTYRAEHKELYGPPAEIIDRMSDADKAVINKFGWDLDYENYSDRLVVQVSDQKGYDMATRTLMQKVQGWSNCDHVFVGYQGGTPYLKIKRGPIDGVGRQHNRIYGECDKCGKSILIGMTHQKIESKQ